MLLSCAENSLIQIPVFETGIIFFSIKVVQKENIFCQNGIQNGKRLDVRVEPPRIELRRVPCPRADTYL